MGYHYRRRHHRSFAHVVAVLLMVCWVADMTALDFGAVDMADTPLVVATALRCIGPLFTPGTVLAVRLKGALHTCVRRTGTNP